MVETQRPCSHDSFFFFLGGVTRGTFYQSDVLESPQIQYPPTPTTPWVAAILHPLIRITVRRHPMPKRRLPRQPHQHPPPRHPSAKKRPTRTKITDNKSYARGQELIHGLYPMHHRLPKHTPRRTGQHPKVIVPVTPRHPPRWKVNGRHYGKHMLRYWRILKMFQPFSMDS